MQPQPLGRLAEPQVGQPGRVEANVQACISPSSSSWAATAAIRSTTSATTPLEYRKDMDPEASSTRITRAVTSAAPCLRRLTATCSLRRESRLRMSTGSCSSPLVKPVEPDGRGAGAGGGGGRGAATRGVWAGSSTVMPKSMAIPARPEAYPCPTARNFHAPCRRYSSPPMKAVSDPAAMSKRASSMPSRRPAAAAPARAPGRRCHRRPTPRARSARRPALRNAGPPRPCRWRPRRRAACPGPHGPGSVARLVVEHEVPVVTHPPHRRDSSADASMSGTPGPADQASSARTTGASTGRLDPLLIALAAMAPVCPPSPESTR
ncbi:hypothetical protein SALBM217S_09341 [Streptomyces griseoloalbus]